MACGTIKIRASMYDTEGTIPLDVDADGFCCTYCSKKVK